MLSRTLTCFLLGLAVGRYFSTDWWYKHSSSIQEIDNGPKLTTHDDGYLTRGREIFLQTAKSLDPTTDKVTTHTYQIMYGQYLLPCYKQNPQMKILEIGLGCDMGYGPGASVALWKELVPKADLWMAEYDGNCVEKHRDTTLAGMNVMVGDQGDPKDLARWMNESGSNFDVIIDDGGHTQCQIWTSFRNLWPAVAPGGLYFIEDMQVAKMKSYKTSTPTCDGTNLNVPNELKSILDDLMYDVKRKSDIEFMFCQSEACVLGKKK